MPILNKRDKIIYTDFPYNLNWMPYLSTSNGNIYFYYKNSVYSKISSVEEYFNKIESLGIKIAPLSDLIVGELESIIEISKNEVIINGEMLTKITSLNALARRFGRKIVRSKGNELYIDDYKRAMLKKLFAEDHLGNCFHTTKAMTDFYDVDYRTFLTRIKQGWGLEKALTTKAISSHKIQDHLGNNFSSISEMVRHYDITRNLFYARMRMGWSLEKILTTPARPIVEKTVIYNGKKYLNHRELAMSLGIDYKLFMNRMKRWGSIEKALLFDRSPRDHLGNEFENVEEMCKYWGINKNTYKDRLKRGWTLKETLEVPPKIRKG